MQFDRFVHKVLKESDETPVPAIIPAFDGQPEIYLTRIKALYDDDGRIASLKYSAAHRSEDWDIAIQEHLLYKGNSYQDAFQVLLTGLREESFNARNFISKQVVRFRDLIGEFRVAYFNDGDQPTMFVFACKLDASWVRSNQINNDLKDADTTGFEALL